MRRPLVVVLMLLLVLPSVATPNLLTNIPINKTIKSVVIESDLLSVLRTRLPAHRRGEKVL